MNNLVTYLRALENRIENLETENRELRALTPRQGCVDENEIEQVVLVYFPNTNPPLTAP